MEEAEGVALAVGECELVYLKGDATVPQAKGNKIVAHIVNTYGGWGKGFVNAISARWGEEPAKLYRQWHRDRATTDFALGAVQFVQVERYVWVANMVAQQGLGREANKKKKRRRKKKKGAKKKNQGNAKEAQKPADSARKNQTRRKGRRAQQEESEEEESEEEEEEEEQENDEEDHNDGEGGPFSKTTAAASSSAGKEKGVYVKYDALGQCLDKVRAKAVEEEASVHMPRIGTGLGGGDWSIIEPLIKTHLRGLQVFVYDQ
ncbi:Appr-1-p processing protein [Balamuthia mandrillaris]